MTVAHIEFSLVHGSEADFPSPYPASKDIPDWFKAMPAEALGQSSRTVKNCPPFLEALTCGYIVPLADDISLSLTATGAFQGQGPIWQEDDRFAKMVQIHRPTQVKGSPFEHCPIVKILSPWLIRTPPGYSTLFLPPLNRFHMPLFPLAGLVETDLFYREVHFPAVLMIQPGATLKLAKGTPLAQVIPIKREEFKGDVVPLDQAQYRAMDLNTRDLPENQNYYKDNYWRKKGYR